MRALFRLNNQRYKQRLGQLMLTFVLTTVVLVVALYLGDQPTVLGRIAVVGETGSELTGPFEFKTVKEIPTNAEIMMGKYDGYLIQEDDSYKVVTPKNKELSKELTSWLSQKRGVKKVNEGSQMLEKVIGFMMMVLLLGGLTFVATIGEDKEQHQLERLLLAPISLGKYLVSQCVYAFLALYLPTLTLFMICQAVIHKELGASLLTYSGLIALICALGISIGTLMMSLFKTGDRATMVTSAILILTTVIAGSFGQIGADHLWFTNFSRILPQKSLLSLAADIQQGGNPLMSGYLLHVIGTIVISLLVGNWVLKWRLKN